MVKKQKQPYLKIIDERFTLSKKRGGGSIRVEAWENDKGDVVRYSIAYINHDKCQNDNGRVIGYDNAHDYHHKHEMGEIYPIEDFTSYADIVERFEKDIKEYIK